MKWVSHAHQMPRKDLDVAYAAVVFGYTLGYRDPSVRRGRGWGNPNLHVQFPRAMRSWFPLSTFRLTNELAITGNYRGGARFGGDFFPVLADRKGRRHGTIAGRYPKSHWHNLGVEVTFLERGEHGAISTTKYEMFREGAQECEARVFIERVLSSRKLRARLGEKKARRIQKLLDERSYAIRQGVGTFTQSGHYVQHYTRGSSWWNCPGLIGAEWYSASDWQTRSKDLFNAAAEVAKSLR